MTKTLNDMKLTAIPFFPKITLGKDIIYVKTIELIEISDHVNLPVIATSQIIHTIIPTKSVTEKSIEMITFFVILFSFFLFSASKFSNLCLIHFVPSFIWNSTPSYVVFPRTNGWTGEIQPLVELLFQNILCRQILIVIPPFYQRLWGVTRWYWNLPWIPIWEKQKKTVNGLIHNAGFMLPLTVLIDYSFPSF